MGGEQGKRIKKSETKKSLSVLKDHQKERISELLEFQRKKRGRGGKH